MPGKRGIPLSGGQKARIREYNRSSGTHRPTEDILASLILAKLGIEVSEVSAARIRQGPRCNRKSWNRQGISHVGARIGDGSSAKNHPPS